MFLGHLNVSVWLLLNAASSGLSENGNEDDEGGAGYDADLSNQDDVMSTPILPLAGRRFNLEGQAGTLVGTTTRLWPAG